MSTEPESSNVTQTFVDDKGRDVPIAGKENFASDSRSSKALAEMSPGVARVEAISSILTTKDRIALFLGVFLISYAYGLDGTLRYTYQPYATASFNSHSLLATVNVLRAVIAASAQPTAAKIADVFGRMELVCISVFFYVLGTIVEAVATNVDVFSAGACIYQIGYTMVIVLVEVIIADMTSSRARLFFSYIPATPFLINTWASGSCPKSSSIAYTNTIVKPILMQTSWCRTYCSRHPRGNDVEMGNRHVVHHLPSLRSASYHYPLDRRSSCPPCRSPRCVQV